MTRFFTLFRAYLPRMGMLWWALVGAVAALAFAVCWRRGAEYSDDERTRRALATSALCCYAFLLLALLVLSRGTRAEASLILTPFYSYRKIFAHTAGSFEWLCLGVFNCLLYLPLGLFCAAYGQTCRAPARLVVLRAAALGFALSLLVETLQLLLRRGTFELDDLLHNTLGAVLGALLWQGAATLHAHLKEKRKP